jgi:hypothetical protein
VTEDGALILGRARSVLLVDWPSADVPDSLVRAGLQVIVKGGPQPDNYSIREVEDDTVVSRPAPAPPDHVDLVYCHRPLDELAGIVALAKRLGASAVWRQSGLDPSGARDPEGCWTPAHDAARARELVESAGLDYVGDVYIGEAARQLSNG